jgi:hypothetical protein
MDLLIKIMGVIEFIRVFTKEQAEDDRAGIPRQIIK